MMANCRIDVGAASAHPRVACDQTCAPQSYLWEYDALSFHGVASGLTAGSHTAELKYRQQSGNVYLPRHETDGSGEGYVRLTSVVLPDTVLATDAIWPPTQHTVSGASWQSIPTGAISTSFTFSGDEVCQASLNPHENASLSPRV